MPYYSYQCDACDNYYEELYHIADYPRSIPCSCGNHANIIIAYAPSLDTSNFDGDFHPYYDDQLAQHFQSLDEKKHWLKQNNYTQPTGPNCPQKDKPGNFRCTKTQSEKLTHKPPSKRK